jgi:uncharacterized protein (TIGR03382 family)
VVHRPNKRLAAAATVSVPPLPSAATTAVLAAMILAATATMAVALAATVALRLSAAHVLFLAGCAASPPTPAMAWLLWLVRSFLFHHFLFWYCFRLETRTGCTFPKFRKTCTSA